MLFSFKSLVNVSVRSNDAMMSKNVDDDCSVKMSCALICYGFVLIITGFIHFFLKSEKN